MNKNYAWFNKMVEQAKEDNIRTKQAINASIQGSDVQYEAIADTLREKGQAPATNDFASWYLNKGGKDIIRPNGGFSK